MEAMNRLAIISAVGLLVSCGGSSPIPPATGDVFNDSLSFTQPTTRADGSALALAEIAQYNARWGNLATGPFTVGNAVIPKGAGATVSWVNSARVEGQFCYVVQTLDTNGQLSVDSAVACSPFKCSLGKKPELTTGLCVAIAKPNAPSNVTAT